MSEFYTEISNHKGINQAVLEESKFKYIKGFALLNLQENDDYAFDAIPHETGLLILEGNCDLEINGIVEKMLGLRNDVWSGKPTAAYVPRDTKFTIRSQKALVGICTAECSEKTEPAIITPDKIKIMNVGRDNWSREVRIVIGPESPSVNLIVGETINPPP